MPRESIPEELRRFILTSDPSVPFVEALLIFRNDPQAALDASFVATSAKRPPQMSWPSYTPLESCKLSRAVACGQRVLFPPVAFEIFVSLGGRPFTRRFSIAAHYLRCRTLRGCA